MVRIWPFGGGRQPTPAPTPTTPAPAPTENPTPVKNTETGDYMLTFLDPATNHRQFTLELSLLKADGSPVIGPLTQKNGIFNLGKLENGEYQWALSRVNTKVNRKTSTRNGNFTISDALTPAVNPPESALPGTTAINTEDLSTNSDDATALATPLTDDATIMQEFGQQLAQLRTSIQESKKHARAARATLQTPVDDDNKDYMRAIALKALVELSAKITLEVGLIQHSSSDPILKSLADFHALIAIYKPEDRMEPDNKPDGLTKAQEAIFNTYKKTITNLNKAIKMFNRRIDELNAAQNEFDSDKIQAHQQQIQELGTKLDAISAKVNPIREGITQAQESSDLQNYINQLAEIETELEDISLDAVEESEKDVKRVIKLIEKLKLGKGSFHGIDTYSERVKEHIKTLDPLAKEIGDMRIAHAQATTGVTPVAAASAEELPPETIAEEEE